MRFYETETLERIGFDFYCDIAGQIVKARTRKGWTQSMLAKESGMKLTRLNQIENVKIRIYLTDLEQLSKVLDVTINWLISAKIDSQVGDCLYLIWSETIPDFKLYQEAASKRMAFLLFDRRLKNIGVAYSNSRERFMVKLVGAPVTNKEIQDKFSKLTSDEEPIDS